MSSKGGVEKKVKKPAAKKPAAATTKKPAAAVKKETSKKPAAEKKTTSTHKTVSAHKKVSPMNKMEYKPPTTGEIIAAFALVFTTCKNEVSLLIVKEFYGKLGAPGGVIAPGETPEQAVRREFMAKTGHDWPAGTHNHSFVYRNTKVFMVYTPECLDTNFGPHKMVYNPAKDPEDRTPLALMHVPVAKLFDVIQNPTEQMPIRPVLTTMFVNSKDEIMGFVKKFK